MSNNWIMRTARNSDISFLFSSWLKSYRESPLMSPIQSAVYFDRFHKALESVFTTSAVLVVCDPDDPDTVFGYGVAEAKGDTLVLHWIYVKHPLRSFGIAKAIEAELLKIPHTNVVYSCRTRITDSFMKTRKYTYDPFYLWSHVK